MSRFRMSIASVLLAFSPALALAEDAPLQQAMAMIPTFPLGADEGLIAQYINVQAVKARGDGTVTGQNWQPLGTMQDYAPIRALLSDDPANWAENAGVGLDQITYFAGYGAAPGDVAIWGFADDASAGAAFAQLSDRGFAEISEIPGFVANGVPMKTDLANINRADPWHGAMGQASAVTLRETALVQAFDPVRIDQLRGEMPSLASQPGGQTLLAALSGSQGEVLQAAFFGPMTGLYGVDPALMISPDPATVQATIAAAAEKAKSGVPLYSAGAVAVLNGADGPATILTLAFADCAVAETAAASAAELWQGTEGAPAGMTVAAATVDAGASGCAAVATAKADDGVAPFLMAFGGLMRRDFAPIRIGTE